LLAEDAVWLDEQARAALDRMRAESETGGVELDASRLGALPAVIRRRAIRFALEGVGVRVDRVAAERIDAVSRGCAERRSGSLTLGQGVLAEFSAGRVRLTCEAQPSAPPRAALIDGESRPSGWDVVVRVQRTPSFHGRGPLGPWRAAFDTDRLPGMLGLRSWRAGDRIHPEGMSGSKLVQDVFVDAKVPRWRRVTAPLVVSGDDVLWVVGFGRDRRYAARPGAPAIEVHVTPELTGSPGDGVGWTDPS
jgi:tRNA(Ile)-lysidine synthase